MAEKREIRWTEIDEEELTIAERCVYRTRRKAMELYQKGCSANEIFLATGINRIAVQRLWNRCCAINPETGECQGYQALIPRSKMKRFVR